MRCKNIKVSLEVPVTKPDGNGIIYAEEAIAKACENANNQPIITYNEKGESIVIGITNSVVYKNGMMLVEGNIYAGGTTDNVLFDDNKRIISMEISGFGLCN